MRRSGENGENGEYMRWSRSHLSCHQQLSLLAGTVEEHQRLSAPLLANQKISNLNSLDSITLKFVATPGQVESVERIERLLVANGNSIRLCLLCSSGKVRAGSMTVFLVV
jgi:hypothetical protein